jgi:putative ABC transport system permease protein
VVDVWRATLSSLLAHKLRLALTTLAVVLGVAFVSGTLIYTDTVRASFDSVFGQISGSVDLSVRGLSELSDAAGGDPFADQRPEVPPAVADEIADVDGVAAVERNVEGVAQIIGDDGQPLTTGNGPPALGFNAPTVEELSPTELRRGRHPTADDEVTIDAGTAGDQGIAVGDTVQIAANGPVTAYDVVGIFGFDGGVDNLAGAPVSLFSPDHAFDLFSVDGGYATVDVLAADDVRLDDLQDRIGATVGDGYQVITSDQLAAESQAAIDVILGFLNTGLLVFAGVSLLVGAFLINNTFAIIVAQRSRELALLRAVGASRAQVMGSVLTEAAVVGVLASGIGLGLGALVAIGLRALLTAFGIDIPSTDLVFAVRTGLVAGTLGIAVTVLSALIPATTALRVPPVAAMQAVAVGDRSGSGRLRTVLGVLLGGSGLVLLGLGLFREAGFPVVIGGAVALLLGAALLARFVTRPLLSIIGWPVDRLGIRGTLARENSIRNPHRTASTAAALMIGLGLVTFALIFGDSLRESTTRTIDEQFVSDFQVRASDFSTFPIEVEDDIAALPEVTGATAMRFGQIGVGGRAGGAAGIEPDELDSAWALEAIDGDLADFERGGLVISDDAAERLGVAAGEVLPVTFPEAGEQDVPVRAVVDGSGLDADYVVDEETLLANSADEGIFTLYLTVADGVNVEDARAAIEGVTDDYPTLQVQDSEQFKQEIAGQVDQLLGLMTALLGLSILIALFGIANTLSLSVFERTHELGLLRAVGATRSQVRSIVRWESVLIAVLGALFGIAVGTVFGWMTVLALADQGLSTFAFPAGQVVIAVLAAAIAGTVAAWLPARRAARVDILRAVATT